MFGIQYMTSRSLDLLVRSSGKSTLLESFGITSTSTFIAMGLDEITGEGGNASRDKEIARV